MSGALIQAASVVLVEVPNISGLTDPLDSTIGAGANRPQVSIRINTDGTIDTATGDTGSSLSYSQDGTWLPDAPADNTDWEIRFTINSEDTGAAGTWTGSTTGSYLALSSARTFTYTLGS